MTLRGTLMVGLGGVVLAALASWCVPLPAARITPDWGLLDGRVAAREQMLGRRLAKAELERVRRRFLDEELLLAYARHSGLDGGSYVERRLVKKMRFLLAGAVPAPSDGELRAFYDANPQRFVPPGRDTPLPFERVRSQLKALITGPRAQALIDARVRALAERYQIVIENGP